MPFKLPLILSVVAAVFKDRADLVAENTALRHQLSCFIHRGPRPRLRPVDRVFWVLLSRFWHSWRETLALVKPATVLAWHRQGFKLFWRWKSRRRGPGRPRISAEVRKLIAEMAEMNVGWGAPRIHGELLKLGIAISEITVSRYTPKRPPPTASRQRGTTFMHSFPLPMAERIRRAMDRQSTTRLPGPCGCDQRTAASACGPVVC